MRALGLGGRSAHQADGSFGLPGLEMTESAGLALAPRTNRQHQPAQRTPLSLVAQSLAMLASLARSFPSSFLTPTGSVELSASVLAALSRLASHPPHHDPCTRLAQEPGRSGRVGLRVTDLELSLQYRAGQAGRAAGACCGAPGAVPFTRRQPAERPALPEELGAQVLREQQQSRPWACIRVDKYRAPS